jgi:hypothetical protein
MPACIVRVARDADCHPWTFALNVCCKEAAAKVFIGVEFAVKGLRDPCHWSQAGAARFLQIGTVQRLPSVVTKRWQGVSAVANPCSELPLGNQSWRVMVALLQSLPDCVEVGRFGHVLASHALCIRQTLKFASDSLTKPWWNDPTDTAVCGKLLQCHCTVSCVKISLQFELLQGSRLDWHLDRHMPCSQHRQSGEPSSLPSLGL